MKLINYLAAGACLLSASLCSCSSDDPTPEPDVTNPNTGVAPQTPAEEKNYIDETASSLAQLLKPADQAPVVNFAADFAREFSGFDFDEAPYMQAAGSGMQNLAKAVKSYDWAGMTRAIREFTFRFDDFAGIYEPDYARHRWVKTGESSDLIVRCKVGGMPAELIVAPSDGTWTGDIQTEAYDWEADEDYLAQMHFIVPKTLTVNLTHGSVKLVSALVKTNVSQKDNKAYAYVDANVANIHVISESNLSNSRVSAHAESYISGVPVYDTDGVLYGNHLCDIDYIAAIAENEDNIDTLFDRGSASANIMKRIFVEGAVKDIYNLSTYIDESDLEYDTRDEAQAGADFLNGKMHANFYMGGAKTPTGYMLWRPVRYVDDWYPMEYEWSVAPMLHFNSDNSDYSVDDYFTHSTFGGIVRMFNALIDEYESFFDFD